MRPVSETFSKIRFEGVSSETAAVAQTVQAHALQYLLPRIAKNFLQNSLNHPGPASVRIIILAAVSVDNV